MTMTAEEAYAEAARRVDEVEFEPYRDVDLSDLEGLEEIPAVDGQRLSVFDLSCTKVSSLKPLRQIKSISLLNLGGTEVFDLGPLRYLQMLEGLYLNETNVAILTDLSEMPFLGVLSLQNTQVSSIEPLSGLQRLFSLNLTGSKVGDLRPALTFKSLKNSNSIEQILYSGLSFRDTPAAASSPELTVLSQIEDDYERTERTLAYLRTLPPYPEPLPWDAPPEPATDNLPRILLNDNQVDVANVPLDTSDLEDPIKARLHARLKASVGDLLRIGNRYPQINAPANALTAILATPFEETDLFDIHLEIAILTDLITINPTLDPSEQIDAECLQTVQQVARLGPPLTLGNPDVELFEARTLQYAQQKRDEAIANSERKMAEALMESPLLTERAAHFAAIAAASPNEGRTASYRTSYVKNVILRGIAALSVGTAAAVWTTETVAALEFLQVNKDLILTIASSWGEQGHVWAADLIARSGEALRKYRA